MVDICRMKAGTSGTWELTPCHFLPHHSDFGFGLKILPSSRRKGESSAIQSDVFSPSWENKHQIDFEGFLFLGEAEELMIGYGNDLVYTKEHFLF